MNVNRSAPITPRNPLQPTSGNRRALIDFNSSPLPPPKRICLTPFTVTQGIAPHDDTEPAATAPIKTRDSIPPEAFQQKKKGRGRPSKF